MPDVCVSKPSAPGYVYSTETGQCFVLGKLENDFAVRQTVLSTCVQYTCL